MSKRITWRSRPRSSYPWPLKTLEVTAADIETEWTSTAPAILGPLPMIAVVEWLYRVRKISYTVSGTIGGTFATATGSSILKTPADAAMDELDAFNAFNQDEFEKTLIFSVPSPRYKETVSGERTCHVDVLIRVNLARPAAWQDYAILHDSNDKFWISSTGDFFADSATPGVSAAAGWFDDGTSYPNRITGTLELTSGTYNIEARSSRSDGALAITATEWHPFRTTADLAAWNTATGAIANGGPGA